MNDSARWMPVSIDMSTHHVLDDDSAIRQVRIKGVLLGMLPTCRVRSFLSTVEKDRYHPVPELPEGLPEQYINPRRANVRRAAAACGMKGDCDVHGHFRGAAEARPMG
ncbi:hypothetical protein [Bradyrhizobium sp.]|uniref:hypothetical protein n=1 Tax=Bradyrhizobium sp. TaxID=376 RepID=UPI002385ABC4|nr:hypothetical protein [Bradyrhizobium sp.]MDE2378466.1 hypothetical protein [Bradyrhizobium sp.]